MQHSQESLRRQVRRLTTVGDFAEAEVTVQDHAQRRQAELAMTLESFAKGAATQWSALQRAKAQCRLEQRAAARAAEQNEYAQLLSAQNTRYRRDEAALARYSLTEQAKLNSIPLNVPQDALVLRDEEARYIMQGSFAAAARSRREAAVAEREHCRASFAQRSATLDRRVSRRADTLLEKEAAAAERDRFAVTALQCRHAEQQQCAATQLRHVEDGMLAAQRRSQRHIIKMRRSGDVSRAATAAAQRGAALERRVYGDAYRVPSLCAFYGPLMDGRPSSS